MRRRIGGVGLTSILAAGLGLLLGACSLEVLNPGAILDEDLNTPELMPVVVNGVSAQFNDVVDDLSYNLARLTDDMSGTGSYFDTGRFRRGIYDDEDSQGDWEQMHEAAWSGGEAWDRMNVVLEGGVNSDEDASRLWMLMGFAHRLLGENFCDVAYNKGPLQPRTAAFDSAIAAFNQAITIGTAAGADAADFVTAARAGLAQAYVGLGDWTSAVAAAALVPTDFVHEAIYNEDANDNVVWEESHGRAELGVWATPALTYGDPAGMADPRTPYRICGTWDDPTNTATSDVTSTGDCDDSGDGAHQGADGRTAHYRQQKYPEEGDNIAVAKGTEMRLIEAEAALLNDDLPGFIASVNEVRAFHGLAGYGAAGGPAPPTVVGALEWPNAMDAFSYPNTGPGNPALEDAWSVLDRERYMTLWVEGRRLWDLWRWDHPFIAGGTQIGAGINPRASCMRIPRIECRLNENITGDPVCS